MLDDSSYSKANEDNFNRDEIDLSYYLNFLIRNKFFISIITILFFLLATVYSLTKKRVWEGRFEIVLKTDIKKPTATLDITQALALSGITGSSQNLKTQVGILESPSVLMPIFDYVNSEKNKSNFDKTNLNFNKWKKNQLDIKLKKGTSILNISYRDTNKSLIIPSLRKLLTHINNILEKIKS